jgi:hypothetical protein
MSTTVNKNAIAAATGVATTGVWDKVKSNKTTTIMIIGVLFFVSMFIASFVQMSNVVGSNDTWNQIQPQVTKIVIMTLIGITGFIVASLAFYIQDPSKAVYFTIVISSLAIGLSFIALSVAAISR